LLKRSVQLAPDYADSHYELGNALAQLQRWSEAITEYRQAIRLKPDLARAYYRLGQVYQQAGDSARAREILAVHSKMRTEAAQNPVQEFLYRLKE
jgi:tetratricopeptide (TPR) repeat protein